jgi:membrane-bound ClpP family serine protease
MTLIITLIAVGILLLAIEVLIIPGFGFAGVIGLLSIIGAVVLAFVEYGQVTGLIVLGCVILITSVATWLILRSNTWKNISLKDIISSKVDSDPSEKGLTVGTKGVAISRLAPGGMARFGKTDTEVRSRSGMIDSGKAIEIVTTDDSKIIVKQID